MPSELLTFGPGADRNATVRSPLRLLTCTTGHDPQHTASHMQWRSAMLSSTAPATSGRAGWVARAAPLSSSDEVRRGSRSRPATHHWHAPGLLRLSHLIVARAQLENGSLGNEPLGNGSWTDRPAETGNVVCSSLPAHVYVCACQHRGASAHSTSAQAPATPRCGVIFPSRRSTRYAVTLQVPRCANFLSLCAAMLRARVPSYNKVCAALDTNAHTLIHAHVHARLLHCRQRSALRGV